MKLNLELDDKICVEMSKIKDFLYTPSYVRFSGAVTEESALEFRKNLNNAELVAQKTKQPCIPIIIDSYGGDVYAVISMLDAMDSCEIPIATIVEGKAMSAGAMMFMNGDEGLRFMGPNAILMIHEASFGKAGKVEEIQSMTQNVSKIQEKLFQKLSINIGRDKFWLMDKIQQNKNADWYLSAFEAKRVGIANHSHLPTLTCSVNVDISFG